MTTVEDLIRFVSCSALVIVITGDSFFSAEADDIADILEINRTGADDRLLERRWEETRRGGGVERELWCEE